MGLERCFVLIDLIEPDAIRIIGVLDHIKAQTAWLIGGRTTGIPEDSLDKLILIAGLDLDRGNDDVHRRSLTLLALAIVGIGSTFEPCDAIHLQSVFPLTGPLIRRLDAGQTALEAGHDIAGEQLIAMQGFFPRRPVGDADHEATKPPADFLQAFDASNAIVWRTY